jgi:hypothetical protein
MGGVRAGVRSRHAEGEGPGQGPTRGSTVGGSALIIGAGCFALFWAIQPTSLDESVPWLPSLALYATSVRVADDRTRSLGARSSPATPGAPHRDHRSRPHRGRPGHGVPTDPGGTGFRGHRPDRRSISARRDLVAPGRLGGDGHPLRRSVPTTGRPGFRRGGAAVPTGAENHVPGVPDPDRGGPSSDRLPTSATNRVVGRASGRRISSTRVIGNARSQFPWEWDERA